jgi:histidine triad (HIT) family protein
MENSNVTSEKNCVFCNIANHKKELLYEDDLIVMFHDIKPMAQVHIQVVPKRHIKNVNYLIKEDIVLLTHMKEKASEYIKSRYEHTNAKEISNLM